MATPPKRIKLIPLGKLLIRKSTKRLTSKRKVGLLALQAQCIESILKWLPLNDLYSVSRTCKTLHNFAGVQFQRIYPNNAISIELMDNQTIQTQYEGKHDLHFSANIQSVTMMSYIFERDPMPLFHYLKTNCCEHLKELNLYRIKCRPNVDYGGSIKTQLRNLHTISFDRCDISDIHKQFLKYCSHLKHLRIKEKGFNVDYGTTWKFHTYPELNSFTFWGWEPKICSNLAVFFQCNPQIKNVNCMDIKAIKTALQLAKNLDNLIVHCETPEEFQMITTLLYQHINHNGVKRFEVAFHYNGNIGAVPKNTKNISLLSNSTAFQGFHGLFTVDKMLVDSVFKSLCNLRKVSLKVSLEDERHVWIAVQKLPLLECVRLYVINYSTTPSNTFQPLTKPFLATLKRLKYLIVSFSNGAFFGHPTDILQLINVVKTKRSFTETTDASPTIIYLDSDTFCKAKFIVPVGDVIQVKPISQLDRTLYADPFLF